MVTNREALLAWWEQLPPMSPGRKLALKVVMFVGGVLWDYLTLRIDRTLDLLLLVLYFIGLCVVFVVQIRAERERWIPSWLAWPAALDLASSFMLGALLSAVGIAVLRATHPGPAAFLIALFVALAIANEAGLAALRGVAARFALVAFFAWQLTALVGPLFTGSLAGPFTLAGVTLFCVGAVLGAVHGGSWRRTPPSQWAAPILGAGTGVGTLLALIALNVVPPLPLVMRDAVVARNVSRVEGKIVVESPQRRSWAEMAVWGFPEITWAPGETVAVFVAVSAPADIDVDLFAVWEWWDPMKGDWVATDRIPQRVHGGRRDGFRSWTRKRNVKGGDWRVRVVQPSDREVGRIRFRVVAE